MTDTEILDYLSKRAEARVSHTHDVDIGGVVFTIGCNNGSKADLRGLLTKAIEEDRVRVAAKVARKLSGEPEPNDYGVIRY